MMFDENIARIRDHCANLRRYRRPLKTMLSDLERHFIEWRLSEERAPVRPLVSQAVSALTLPKAPGVLSSVEATS